MTARILVIEDDAKLVRALRRGLTLEGYSVESCEDGERGLETALTESFDAIVLDLMLPGLDGFAVCETLRQRDRGVPVLMLTALDDVADRIRGLDGGADDYLAKPFDFGELLARLRVLIRRGPDQRSRAFTVANLRIDPATRVVTRAGRQVELTQREFDLFGYLLAHRGRVVTRAEILRAVWDPDYRGSANVTDVYIGYLRKKLEPTSGPPLIRTIRGRGFMLDAP